MGHTWDTQRAWAQTLLILCHTLQLFEVTTLKLIHNVSLLFPFERGRHRGVQCEHTFKANTSNSTLKPKNGSFTATGKEYVEPETLQKLE